MRSDPRADVAVMSLLGSHAPGARAEELITRLCIELLAEADCGIPVDDRLLASLCNARIEVVEQREAGCVRWNGRHFIIRVRRADSPQRRRFTVLHEVIHILFLQAGAVGHERRDPSVGAFDPGRREEYLCDFGAAELLLPRPVFIRACPKAPDMEDVVRLAERFEASIEATARRVVSCLDQPAALVILEPRLKPVELRRLAQAQTQGSLPGMDGPVFEPKLRVHYSFSDGAPFIPPHKSIDARTPLAQVLDHGKVDYIGATGLISGEFRVSARLMPYRRDGALVQRVIALLFAPSPEGRRLVRQA